MCPFKIDRQIHNNSIKSLICKSQEFKICFSLKFHFVFFESALIQQLKFNLPKLFKCSLLPWTIYSSFFLQIFTVCQKEQNEH